MDFSKGMGAWDGSEFKKENTMSWEKIRVNEFCGPPASLPLPTTFEETTKCNSAFQVMQTVLL
jgi:hypothetical protein